MGAILGIGANLLAVFILSVESSMFFNQKIMTSGGGSSPYRYGSAESNTIRSLRNLEKLSLSLIWGVYSAVLMVVGIVRHSRAARVLALMGFGVVIVKVFLFDVSVLSDLYRIASFIALGIILLVVSFLFYRYKDKIKEFIMA